MKKFLITCLSLALIASAGFIASCSDDETFDLPTITLDPTAVTASPGEVVSINITTTTDAGFEKIVVKKQWEGTAQSETTLTSAPTAPYQYTVTEADADHILTLNFTVTDKKGKTASKEVVITVELTPRQLLLKYNWRLDAEIWKKNNTNEITDVYNDDVYRFNNDHPTRPTYDKSIGAKVDDFSDLWYNYCYYDLNDNTLRLLMSRTGAFGEEVTDTLKITVIDETKMYADINYYDLNVFDPKYAQKEAFQKRFVAVPKTSSFDPYKNGSADDAGPAGACADVTFDND